MNFIKYTNDGKAVIQPAALILSNLHNEDTLEMHTLENAIVLLKKQMTPLEKGATMIALMRLVNSLTADLMCGFDEDEDADEEAGADDEDFCPDAIPIPTEAFEDAGLFGKNLRIQVIDGAVIVTEDVDDD